MGSDTDEPKKARINLGRKQKREQRHYYARNVYRGTDQRLPVESALLSEAGKDRQKKLPLVLLYAIRTHVQTSLGHSPFEELFGRQPRTLLDMLAEQWEETEEEVKDLVSYTQDLRDNLHTVWEKAHTALRETQMKQKQVYDARSVVRSLTVGDKALVLLPSSENKLLA
ncbi:hypothetical protein NDU88_006236 [Pleurodeles waltl]|uniref:Uncharacterized protein n=1 Tax=Pleurodeles waltl TaxID=8319 RepID=A0AAV7TX29_PLEWA|nr:hypothetical protein NDU88_006236 [Pleurodeles waltl]